MPRCPAGHRPASHPPGTRAPQGWDALPPESPRRRPGNHCPIPRAPQGWDALPLESPRHLPGNPPAPRAVWLGAAFALSLAALAAWGQAAEAPPAPAAADDSAVRFSIFSAAWNAAAPAAGTVKTDDGLRVLAFNSLPYPLRLRQLTLLPATAADAEVNLSLDVHLPAGGYGEQETGYLDWLDGDACISDALAENWRLTEISNYALHPSVRKLIIEDSDSFRIHQCVRSVRIRWLHGETGAVGEHEGWALFHFEAQRD